MRRELLPWNLFNSATLMLISVVPPQQCSQIATPNTFTYINQTTPEKLLKENYRP
jgi:hypothetical protein